MVLSWSFVIIPSQEETRKSFQGGKGAVAPPQFWSTTNVNRPEKGAGFFSPPKYLVPQRLIANSRYLRRFPAFSGVFRRLPASSGVFRRFLAFSGALAISFHCGTKYLGGAQTPTPFSGWLKIIVPKWGGSGHLSPLKTFFLVSSRASQN